MRPPARDEYDTLAFYDPEAKERVLSLLEKYEQRQAETVALWARLGRTPEQIALAMPSCILSHAQLLGFVKFRGMWSKNRVQSFGEYVTGVKWATFPVREVQFVRAT